MGSSNGRIFDFDSKELGSTPRPTTKRNTMTDIINFNGTTTNDIPSGQVLEEAKKAGVTCVIVLGYDVNGNEYFASSSANADELLWLLERAKRQLLSFFD